MIVYYAQLHINALYLWYHNYELLHDLQRQIQSVWMKGTQNKVIISQKEFIIHIYGLHHYKGNLTESFLSI
jgi:hypothetical protein